MMTSRFLPLLSWMFWATFLHSPPAWSAPEPGKLPKRVPGSSIVQQCAKHYTPEWQPVTGESMVPVPQDPRPPKGVPIIDPVHKTCVVRVTDHDSETKSGFARSDYSRRQSFNADNTRMIISSRDGSWHLYAMADFQHLGPLKNLAGDAEPQWHPTNPDVLYYLPAYGIGLKLNELNIATGVTQVVGDFAARLKVKWPSANAAWTKTEGSPSKDGRYWCFMVDDEKWKGLGVFTWDRDTDTIIAMMDHAGERPDHVSMSPSGNYCVTASNSGTIAHNRDLSKPRFLRPRGEHSDLALDAKGEDVYVSIDYQGSGGPIFMQSLRTGERTVLAKTYLNHTGTAMHFSGKAFQRPGWVVISTYADEGKAGQQWLHRKVFALSLEKEPRIINLAHHHTQYDGYFTEPQATPNRDMTRILFNSNWGTKSKTDVEAFMVVVPEKAFGSIPARY
jgi:hypothetical protein